MIETVTDVMTARQKQIITYLHELEAELGRPPKVKDLVGTRKTGRAYSYLTVIRAFGSWDGAMAAAGYVPRGKGRPPNA
jgi:hypothetical protein